MFPLMKSIACVVLLAVPMIWGAIGQAQVLQGRVEHSTEMLRLSSPPRVAPGNLSSTPSHSLRISRQAVQPTFNSQAPLVDTSAFSKPLTGSVDQSGLRLGVLKPDSFALPPQNKFDIGTERGSREMTIAWERWHRQLSSAIYERWSDRAESAGRATIRITVTKDRRIQPVILSSTGGAEFRETILSAIMSLDGNAGLAFPGKSLRDKVTFEADYVAARNVKPGFSWVKNDYEKIRQDY